MEHPVVRNAIALVVMASLVHSGLAASQLPITGFRKAGALRWDGGISSPVVRASGHTSVVRFPDGVVVDSGYYDYQENGSVPKRLVFTGSGALHGIWMSSPDSLEGFPNRNCWYYYATPGGNLMRLARVTVTRSGFCAIDVLPSFPGLGEPAAVGCHSGDQPNGVTTSTIYHDFFEGQGSFIPHWDNMQDDTGENNLIIWPKIGVNPITAGITVAANASAEDSPGYQWVTYLQPDSVYSGSLDPWYNLTPDLSRFNGDAVEWPTVAVRSDGSMTGILVNDIGGDLRLYESPSGDFSSADFNVTNITRFDDSELDTVEYGGGGSIDTTKIGFRPWHTADFIYDLGGTPHVVWAEGRALVDEATGETIILVGLEIGGEIWSLNYRVRHWDPYTGISTVYLSQRGTQDTVITPVNTLPTSYPTIGVSEDNRYLYVAWQEMRDEWRDDAPRDYGFGEIMSVTADNGDTNWTARENLVNASDEPSMDDRFPSVARLNPGGKVHLLYVTDPEGSNFAYIGGGEAAPITLCYLVYADFDPAPPKVGIEDGAPMSPPAPVAQHLMQNYPNPFNPRTIIRYSLASETHVRLTIHNVRGEVVRILVNARQRAGEHAVTWEGQNGSGVSVASGVYFYRLRLGGGSAVTRKMVLSR